MIGCFDSFSSFRGFRDQGEKGKGLESAKVGDEGDGDDLEVLFLWGECLAFYATDGGMFLLLFSLAEVFNLMMDLKVGRNFMLAITREWWRWRRHYGSAGVMRLHFSELGYLEFFGVLKWECWYKESKKKLNRFLRNKKLIFQLL